MMMGAGVRTLAAHATAIDGGAADHDIVHDGEAALATDPVALAVPDAAVGQDGGLVEVDAATMELLGEGDLVGVEEVPAGLVDDLVRGMAEDVDDGVGRVENVGILGEICTCELAWASPAKDGWDYRGW